MARSMNKAEISIIEGEQGAGKTNTAVAKLVDAIKDGINTKIFTNFHLYGIRYVYTDLATIVEYLNTKLMSATKDEEVYVVIDESYIGGDARRGATLLSQVLTWFGSQIRKRRLHLILIAQHGRMVDWRFRFFMTEHIICSFNEKTNYITLSITRKGEKKKRAINYYAPEYWKYYDTNELPQIPQKILDKVLTGAR